jgi:hypothetical protein
MLTDIGWYIKQLVDAWMGDSGAGLFVLFVCNVLHLEVGFGNVMNKLDLSIISTPWNTII